MNTSLRTRLLISYGLLVALLLLLFSLGTFWSLLSNPLAYESAAQQLRSAQRVLTARGSLLSPSSAGDVQAQVQRTAEVLQVRVILLQPAGTQLADSQAAGSPPIIAPALRVHNLKQRNEIALLRDRSKRLWLALVQPLDDGSLVMLAVRRPRLGAWQFFRSELMRPALITGLAGLGLAALLSIFLARSISSPLKRIGAAADDVAAGNFHAIQPQGPAEVRRLAGSFNHMLRRVQDAQQSQRDLAANVSHELKTPLTSIRGFAQAIQDGLISSPEDSRKAAGIILGETCRMSRLVQDLLNLSRLQAGTAGLRCAPVDLAGLLRAAADKFAPQIAQAGIQFDSQVPDLPQVQGDEDRLAEVVSNLLDNAIKFTPPGGSVRLSAGAAGGRVIISVMDTGPGIPPGERERVFERFYRSGGAQAGSGLGLAITRQIVLAHGGNIDVQENSPQGCIFRVLLPV